MKTDVLIIGYGLAGLYTALQIQNKQVVVVSKGSIAETNSYLAQGGISAEMQISEKALTSHIDDTLKAGKWYNNAIATATLVKEAKENIEQLINYGVAFDKVDGKLNLSLEAGHSSKRVLHAGGDATGKIILKSLLKKINEKDNIKVVDKVFVKDLLIANNTCYGISYFDKNEIKEIRAKITVLATGGIGGLYLNSTNVKYATGDGIAIAKRAGAIIDDLEFIQFHPTALYTENQQKNFLISEALRGENAYLVNSNHERFMHKYDDNLELAPRDILAISIVKEMYDTWHDCVYLDTRHLDKDYLQKRFPTIYKTCLKYGFILGEHLLPVIPVQHYSIGGICINTDGETSINNLYANGEVANSGVHGANRLASNSLLECVVFGRRIAQHINNKNITLSSSYKSKNQMIGNKNISYFSIVKDIKRTMNTEVSVVKTLAGLKRAKEIISTHYQNLLQNPNITKNYYKVLNMATTAKLIIESSLKRPKSIGCHNIVESIK